MPTLRPANPALLILIMLLACNLYGCGLGNRFIFNSNDQILSKPDQFGMTFEDVWFKSTDGISLHGWYIPSSSSDYLVVYFHGNAANISHRMEILHYLNQLDLSVFIFDYRGFGVSEGIPLREKDLYRDAQGAVKWLEQKGWRLDQMIFFGRSMGAAIALQTALDTPPAGVILEAPFTSLSEIARKITPTIYAFFGWWNINTRFDNLNKISRLTRPLLMVHGIRDRTVPVEMSLRLFDRAAEPKSLLLIPEAGHSDSFKAGGETYREAWVNFIHRIEDRKIVESRLHTGP